MSDVNKVYTVYQALNCIKAPFLTKQVFEQNQMTIENLIQLYSLNDKAKIHLQSLYTQSYYSNLSAVFLKLKDPHTLFQKPMFYSYFSLVFPLQFYFNEDKFYFKRFPTNSPLNNNTCMYENQFGKIQFDENDEIITINNLQAIDYLQKLADKYEHASKNQHGRLNALLSGTVYEQRLDIYNILENEDQTLNILFESQTKLKLQFVIKTSTQFDRVDAAISQYQIEIRQKSSYSEENYQEVKQQVFELFDYKHTQILNTERDDSLQLIESSDNLYKLFKYQQNDFVLQLLSFSPANLTLGLQDIIRLLKQLQNIKNEKLYISVVQNNGCYVGLGHLLATGLFHAEYPIYGQYNLKKSKIAELLLKSGSNTEDMHRIDFTTGITLQNITSLNRTINYDWYQNTTINNTHSMYYSLIKTNMTHITIVSRAVKSGDCSSLIEKLNNIILIKNITLSDIIYQCSLKTTSMFSELTDNTIISILNSSITDFILEAASGIDSGSIIMGTHIDIECAQPGSSTNSVPGDIICTRE